VPASLNDAKHYQRTLYRLAKWRRRESNPEADSHFTLENKALSQIANGLAADWQRKSCQCGDDVESDLQIVRELHFLHTAWHHLTADSRRQIMYAIDAVRNQHSDDHHLAQ